MLLQMTTKGRVSGKVASLLIQPWLRKPPWVDFTSGISWSKYFVPEAGLTYQSQTKLVARMFVPGMPTLFKFGGAIRRRILTSMLGCRADINLMALVIRVPPRRDVRGGYWLESDHAVW